MQRERSADQVQGGGDRPRPSGMRSFKGLSLKLVYFSLNFNPLRVKISLHPRLRQRKLSTSQTRSSVSSKPTCVCVGSWAGRGRTSILFLIC